MRPRFCDMCEREEMRRAIACVDAEDAATAKGEDYSCTCPPIPECTHVSENGSLDQ